MRKILMSLTALASLSAAAPAMAERVSPEAQLANLLEGRVAGEPQSCLSVTRTMNSRIIPGQAIVYEGVGDTIYVNRLRGGREHLDRFDVLVSEINGGSLCRGEAIRTIDSSSQMLTGIVFLDEFIPYRRVRSSDGN
jgi:hypothetical protein